MYGEHHIDLRLAILAAGEVFGGVERQIVDLCRFLVREDFCAPLVILFHDSELASQIREFGIQPIIISGNSRYDFSIIKQLALLLKSNNINVVHSHGYKATIIGGMAKKKVKFRHVKTEHGLPEAGLANPLAWVKARLNFQLEQFLTNHSVDCVRYVTNEMKDSFDNKHKILDRMTIYNGIDAINMEKFQRPVDLPKLGFNIGIVGRVSHVKGIPYALEALNSESVDDQVNLIIIGNGPALDELSDRASRLGLSNRVHFLGFKRNVFEYLAFIDALMIPSLHEGLPYTLLEAMSLGRSIIASDVGGLKEVLKHGKTGLLVPVGDVNGLRNAIGVIQDAEVRTRFGRAAKDLQNRELTLDIMGKKYLSSYSGESN